MYKLYWLGVVNRIYLEALYFFEIAKESSSNQGLLYFVNMLLNIS
jgi:hypothetical protein